MNSSVDVDDSIGVVDDAELVLPLRLVPRAMPAAAGADAVDTHRQVTQPWLHQAKLDRQHRARFVFADLGHRDSDHRQHYQPTEEAERKAGPSLGMAEAEILGIALAVAHASIRRVGSIVHMKSRSRPVAGIGPGIVKRR